MGVFVPPKIKAHSHNQHREGCQGNPVSRWERRLHSPLYHFARRKIADRTRDLVLQHFDGSDETIPTPRKGLNETWVVCRISYRFSQAVDRGIDTIVEVDKCVLAPEVLSQLLSCDHLARMLEEGGENLKWLSLELEEHPIFS